MSEREMAGVSGYVSKYGKPPDTAQRLLEFCRNAGVPLNFKEARNAVAAVEKGGAVLHASSAPADEAAAVGVGRVATEGDTDAHDPSSADIKQRFSSLEEQARRDRVQYRLKRMEKKVRQEFPDDAARAKALVDQVIKEQEVAWRRDDPLMQGYERLGLTNVMDSIELTSLGKDPHLLLGLTKNAVLSLLQDLGFPGGYKRGHTMGDLYEEDWITSAFGEALTGYDCKYCLTHWLVDGQHEAFSVAEVFLKHGREGVGAAKLFVSHVQKETVEATLLLGDQRESDIPNDVPLWLDYTTLRQCLNDFVPKQIQASIARISRTVAVEDSGGTYLKRSFCLFELVSTPSNCLVFPLNDLRKDDMQRIHKFGARTRMRIDAESAQATNSEDKRKVDGDIRASGGFDIFNKRVSDAIEAAFLKAVLTKDGMALEFASKEMKNTLEVVKAAVSQNPAAWRYASEEMQNNVEVVKVIVRQKRWTLRHASKEMQNTLEVVKAAVNQDASALEYASKEMQNTLEVVKAAVNQDASALRYASKEMQNTLEVVKAAVSQHGCLLLHASREMQNTLEVVKAAVNQNASALEYASREMRNNKEVVMAAVSKDGYALHLASREMQNTLEVVKAAVNQKGWVLKYASREMQNNKEVVMAAVF